ncbi:MAG: hypothetical protein DRP74_04605 [Candidatus Omnitrophota bacterium]|nr:MAG: hypothetical protein DRP74_04605 [Candidatus Omnitrophota bacterium]
MPLTISNYKKSLKIIFILLPLFFLFLNTCLCLAQDKIVAVVNEDAITQRDVEEFLNFTQVQLSSGHEKDALEEKIKSMKEGLLEKLIEDKLILQEAKKANITINENMVKQKINEIKNNFYSDNEFQTALKNEGLAQADLEAKIRDQMLMYSIIDQKIRSNITVSPIEISAFYEANREKFNTPEKREFTYLVFDDEKMASEYYQLLLNSPDIDKTIYENSLDVNKICFTQGEEIKKEIEEAISGLNKGQISAPFRIENKFYIFKFEEIIPEQQKSLNESQGAIYAYLFEKKMQEELSKWLEELKSKAYIKVL